MLLTTPLGRIKLFIDSEQIVYRYEKITNNRTCPDLSGHYLICVNYIPNGNIHTISCVLDGHIPNMSDEVETGENLELKSFWKNRTKLSIGMTGDSGYLADGTRLNPDFDYDNEYLSNGVLYRILPHTKTTMYKFGIAWLENCSVDREVRHGSVQTPHI